MSVLQFRKAERKKAKLRLGISGPAGSGKTYASLQIAIGLKEKIAMIDTENGSGDLYADICDYDILQITAPFTPDKYIQAIKAAEEAEYGTIIIDSLSHAWAGEGGLLDLHGKIADSGKGNFYTAWRFVTPKHKAAYLDWTVEKREIYFKEETGVFTSANAFATVKTDINLPLGNLLRNKGSSPVHPAINIL